MNLKLLKNNKEIINAFDKIFDVYNDKKMSKAQMLKLSNMLYNELISKQTKKKEREDYELSVYSKK